MEQTLQLPFDKKSGSCLRMAPLRMLYIMTFYKSTFQGHEFLNENISKTISASKKCTRMTFIEAYICHRMTPLPMLYSLTLIFTFNVKHFLVMRLL